MVAWQTTNPQQVAAYISQQASARGIDPATAVAVANSEGLNNPVGDAGKSFGPFQLYTGGGLGGSFQQQTGLNPANYEQNWQQQVQWFLNWVTQNGWNPGGQGLGANYVPGTGGGDHGANVAGISNWQGLSGSHPLPLQMSNGSVVTEPGGPSIQIPAMPQLPGQQQVPGQTQIPAPGTPTGGTPQISTDFSPIMHLLIAIALFILGVALIITGFLILKNPDQTVNVTARGIGQAGGKIKEAAAEALAAGA